MHVPAARAGESGEAMLWALGGLVKVETRASPRPTLAWHRRFFPPSPHLDYLELQVAENPNPGRWAQ